jgi:hypothetical protein
MNEQTKASDRTLIAQQSKTNEQGNQINGGSRAINQRIRI